MFAIGLSVAVFGFTCSEAFLNFIFGPYWATSVRPPLLTSCQSAVVIMQFYCLYCLFMAVNGVTEAYLYSKTDQSGMRAL